jgi:hypothetical protein
MISIISESRALSEEFLLVKKTNLVGLFSLLTREQSLEFLKLSGLSQPDLSDPDELALWVNDVLIELGVKQKDIASQAGVNPCDVSYLLNKVDRINGSGRKEKIIKTLTEKLEEKHGSSAFKKSS